MSKTRCRRRSATSREPAWAPSSAAMGIVFGGIATSPLYTLQECLSGPHGVTPQPRQRAWLHFAHCLVADPRRDREVRRRPHAGGQERRGRHHCVAGLVPHSLRERAPGVLGTTMVFVLMVLRCCSATG